MPENRRDGWRSALRSLTKKDKNGGRAVQKGNVLLAQGGDHLRGIEPMLQPDARAEANKQRQQRRQAGDVDR